MAPSTPSPRKTNNDAAGANLAPPNERFWRHYSPHGELPLSSVSSFVVHLLLFGLLGLIAWVGVVLFSHGTRSLPVEAVRLDMGGSTPGGQGGDPGTNEEPIEDPPLKEPTGNPQQVPVKSANLPDPSVKETPRFDAPQRRLSVADTSKEIDKFRKWINENKSTGSKPPSPGNGGEGSGSIGSTNGPGAGTLTQQEIKRRLRWTMLFNVNNSRDYVAQLRGLKAILAIPVHEDANGAQYEIIRDLSARSAKPAKENIKDIQRMVYWVDNKADSVQGVLSVLGISRRPSHFIAFMPAELETKLLNLEIAYLHKRHPNRKEDDISSTTFRIEIRQGKYEPVVSDQKLNK